MSVASLCAPWASLLADARSFSASSFSSLTIWGRRCFIFVINFSLRPGPEADQIGNEFWAIFRGFGAIRFWPREDFCFSPEIANSKKMAQDRFSFAAQKIWLNFAKWLQNYIWLLGWLQKCSCSRNRNQIWTSPIEVTSLVTKHGYVFMFTGLQRT